MLNASIYDGKNEEKIEASSGENSCAHAL